MPRLILRILALSLILSPAAVAQSISAPEREDLEITLSAYERALIAGDPSPYTEALPPSLMRYLSEDMGLDPAEGRRIFTEALVDLLRSATVTGHELPLAEARIRAPRDGFAYAVIPSWIDIEYDGYRLRQFDTTLALREGDAWYPVRITDPQRAAIVRAAYPALNGENLPMPRIGIASEAPQAVNER